MTTQINPKVFALDTASVGNGKVIPDARFGKVTELAANQNMVVSQFTGYEVSLSVWLKRQTVIDDIQLCIEGGWSINESGLVLLDGNETGQYVPQGQWHQFCIVRTTKSVKLYINGIFAAAVDKEQLAIIGALSYISISGQVCLAQQHTYDHALDATAIQSCYISGLPTVKKTFSQIQPIAFSLLHPKNGPNAGSLANELLIVDVVGESTVPQQLQLTNESETKIELLEEGQGTVSAENYHFELRIRNGVFENIEKALIFASKSDWSISKPSQNIVDNTWSVYFLATQSLSLGAGEKTTFDFTYRTVNGALKERPTTINLSYQKMKFAGGERLRGDRHIPVNIVNLSSNNIFLTDLNKQITEANKIINEMEVMTTSELDELKIELDKSRKEFNHRRKDFEQGLPAEVDAKLITLLSDINSRLTKLDSEVDNRTEAVNSSIERLEAGLPLTAFAHSEKGIVCNQQNNAFNIYLRNTSNKTLSFGSSGSIKIKVPLGIKEGDLASKESGCGSCSASSPIDFNYTVDKLDPEPDGMPVYTFNYTRPTELQVDSEDEHFNLQPEDELSFLFDNITPNNLTGEVILIIEVDGLENYQAQTLRVTLNKVKKDISNFVGGGYVGIGIEKPSVELEVKGTIKADRFIDENNVNYYLDPSSTSKVNGLNVAERVNARGFSGHGIVPIGTVIDWYRPSSSTPIPSGWRIADGTKISSTDKGAHRSLHDKSLPNLNGHFVRGETSSSFSGCKYGGNDSHRHYNNFDSTSDGAHNHKWLLYSGKSIYTYNSSGRLHFTSNWINGHDTDGRGYYSYTWKSWHDGYTDKESSHRHRVSGWTDRRSNIPRYVGLLKLIRVL